jgi:hypothetical protein
VSWFKKKPVKLRSYTQYEFSKLLGDEIRTEWRICRLLELKNPKEIEKIIAKAEAKLPPPEPRLKSQLDFYKPFNCPNYTLEEHDARIEELIRAQTTGNAFTNFFRWLCGQK